MSKHPMIEFKPDDFNDLAMGSYPDGMRFREAAAMFANAKLEKLLSSAKVIEGCDGAWEESWHRGYRPTHQALLLNIQPIEPCKHEADLNETWQNADGTLRYFCKHCKVEVEPIWGAHMTQTFEASLQAIRQRMEAAKISPTGHDAHIRLDYYAVTDIARLLNVIERQREFAKDAIYAIGMELKQTADDILAAQKAYDAELAQLMESGE